MSNRAHAKFFYGIVFPEELYPKSDLEGMTVGLVGHCEDGRYFVALKETYVVTKPFREDVLPLDLGDPPEGANKKLQDACEDLGLPYEQPRWYLVSSYE